MSVRKLPYYAQMRASPTITRDRVTIHDPTSAGDSNNSTLPYRYDVDGQQVLEDFEVEEIMGSENSTGRKNVLYRIKWTGYPEQSEWTEEPFEHWPRALVREFHKRHPEATMDDKLKKKVMRR